MPTRPQALATAQTGLGLLQAALRDDQEAMDYLLADQSPEELLYLTIFCTRHAAYAYQRVGDTDRIADALQSVALRFAAP